MTQYNDWPRRRAVSARRSGNHEKRDVDIVFEHPGEQTFPVSCLAVKRAAVVFCAGTTGFNITFDARYVWMRQKHPGLAFRHLAGQRRQPVRSTAASTPA